MYGMTLEINQKCNLVCEYCYLREKNNESMLLETAYKSIDHAFDKIRLHKEKKLVFDFVGGEALLDFDLLKEIVKYIESKNKLYLYEINYGLTTNGTIFSDKIVDWLIRHNFNLKLSIDGNREVTNLGRKMRNHQDVYGAIIDNWKYIKKYESELKKPIQVTNVVTKENYKHYAESFIHLIEDLHIKTIFTVFDISAIWTENEVQYIEKEIEKAFNYFVNNINTNPIYWNFISEVKRSVLPNKKFYSCGSGLIYLYVKVNGDLYACANAIQSGSKLGNIYTGYNNNAINFLKNLEYIENDNCLHCNLYECCNAKGCIYKSLAENGTIDIPSKFLCWQQKFNYKFYYDHKKNIDGLSRREN